MSFNNYDLWVVRQCLILSVRTGHGKIDSHICLCCRQRRLLPLSQTVANCCMAVFLLMMILNLVRFCWDAAAQCTHAHARLRTHAARPCARAGMYACTPAHTRMHAREHAYVHSCTHAHTHTALGCAMRILPRRSLCTVMPSVCLSMRGLRASQHRTHQRGFSGRN